MAARKQPNSTSTPKPRKPRTPVEKVFVVDDGMGDGEIRLVAGYTKRKVEAHVWRRPKVRLATPADLREAMAQGAHIENSTPQQRVDEAPAQEPAAPSTHGEAPL